MEGVPIVPEHSDDTEPSEAEVKDTKKSKDKKRSVFEKLLKGDEVTANKESERQVEPPKRLFEIFGVEKKDNVTQDDAEKTDTTKSHEKSEKDEASVEELSTEEQQLAAEEYIQARVAELEREQAELEEDSLESQEVQANTLLLERLEAALKETDDFDTETLDAVVEEVAAEFDDELDASRAEALGPDENFLSSYEDPVVDSLPTVPVSGSTNVSPVIPAAPVVMAAKPLTKSVPEVALPKIHKEASSMLLGGIVGYMIGRRQGRLQSEQQMKPVQEKLAHKVSQLHEEIGKREEKIRQFVREAAERQTREKPEKPAEKTESLSERPMERIGNLISVERLAAYKAINPVSEKQKPADVMTLSELLAVGKTIKTEQTNLKKLYEAGRLDERSLRELIQLSQKGERIESRLKKRLKPVEVVPSPESLGQMNTPASFPPIASVANIVEDSIQQAQMPTQTLLPTMPADYPVYVPTRSLRIKRQAVTKLPIVIGVTLGIIITLFIIL